MKAYPPDDERFVKRQTSVQDWPVFSDKADLGPHFGEAACILTIRNCSMEVSVKRVLITGMSGTGKSSVIHQLAAQGFEAVDLDSDEFSHWVEVLPSTSEHPTPAPGRDRVWREDRVQEILANESVDVLFVSGCAENMRKFGSEQEFVETMNCQAF